MQEENINFPEFLLVHEPKQADDLRDQDVLIPCHFKCPRSLCWS
uniref:Uncharacterized protein n=1 Tax=Myoviridae sp. ctzS633 TaxID=2825212 RepID=A0A8S5PUN4_9CAUD|nr:MAG TPA: hypothetical protein [Myoviridae sp. ctzS633]